MARAARAAQRLIEQALARMDAEQERALRDRLLLTLFALHDRRPDAYSLEDLRADLRTAGFTYHTANAMRQAWREARRREGPRAA